jgi:uncharacterized protein (TIGR02117 family)
VRLPVLLVLAGWLAGCAVVPKNAPVPSGEATVYVVDRGWHTDIALPADEVAGPLGSLERAFPDARFLVFGFGARRYYMAEHAGPGDLLAALLPDDGVILVTALHAPPTEALAAGSVVTLHVTPNGLGRITMRLEAAFARTPDGSPVRLAEGPDPDSAFYASTEAYDALHTCNTWTATLLREAGLPVDPHVLFAGQVMRQARAIAARQTEPRNGQAPVLRLLQLDQAPPDLPTPLHHVLDVGRVAPAHRA